MTEETIGGAAFKQCFTLSIEVGRHGVSGLLRDLGPPFRQKRTDLFFMLANCAMVADQGPTS